MATTFDGCGGGIGTGSGGLLIPPETRDIGSWMVFQLETRFGWLHDMYAPWGKNPLTAWTWNCCIFNNRSCNLYPTTKHAPITRFDKRTRMPCLTECHVVPSIRIHRCIMDGVWLKTISGRKKQTSWCDLVRRPINHCNGRHLSCLSHLPVDDSVGTCKGDQSVNTRYNDLLSICKATFVCAIDGTWKIHQGDNFFCVSNTWSMGHRSKGTFLWFKQTLDGTWANKEIQILWL